MEAGTIEITRRDGAGYELSATQWLPRGPAELYPFFASARNLQRITPPWLSFEVLTPEPIVMREGALIDYRLKLHGIPIRWRSRIAKWQPPYKFVDEQVKGPYRQWYHEHLLRAGDGGTWMIDKVTYRVPGGAVFGRLAHWAIVGRDVRRIFAYRQQVLDRLFQRAGAQRS